MCSLFTHILTSFTIRIDAIILWMKIWNEWVQSCCHAQLCHRVTANSGSENDTTFAFNMNLAIWTLHFIQFIRPMIRRRHRHSMLRESFDLYALATGECLFVEFGEPLRRDQLPFSSIEYDLDSLLLLSIFTVGWKKYVRKWRLREINMKRHSSAHYVRLRIKYIYLQLCTHSRISTHTSR